MSLHPRIFDIAMIRIQAEAISRISNSLSMLNALLKRAKAAEALDDEKRAVIGDIFKRCSLHCKVLSLKMTQLQFDQLIKNTKAATTAQSIQAQVGEVTNRFHDELSLHCFF